MVYNEERYTSSLGVQGLSTRSIIVKVNRLFHYRLARLRPRPTSMEAPPRWYSVEWPALRAGGWAARPARSDRTRREGETRAAFEAEAHQGVMANSWRVFKFGGSSVADAASMRRVADIIEGEPAGPLAVVLSACKGVTDGLLDLVSAAERQEPAGAGPGRPPAAAHWPSPPRSARRTMSPRSRPSSTRMRPTSSAGSGPRPRRSRPPRKPATSSPATASCGRRGMFARSLGARGRRGAGAVARRARRRRGAVGPARPGRAVAGVAPARRGAGAGWLARHAHRARLHRPHAGGRADDARTQRLGLLGVDLRRRAQRLRDSHLDRRRRRAQRRSPARARRHRHRLAVVPRGDGAGLLRRQGDPSRRRWPRR